MAGVRSTGQPLRTRTARPRGPRCSRRCRWGREEPATRARASSPERAAFRPLVDAREGIVVRARSVADQRGHATLVEHAPQIRDRRSDRLTGVLEAARSELDALIHLPPDAAEMCVELG